MLFFLTLVIIVYFCETLGKFSQILGSRSTINSEMRLWISGASQWGKDHEKCGACLTSAGDSFVGTVLKGLSRSGRGGR